MRFISCALNVAKTLAICEKNIRQTLISSIELHEAMFCATRVASVVSSHGDMLSNISFFMQKQFILCFHRIHLLRIHNHEVYMDKITYINKASCLIDNVEFEGCATIGPNVILKDCKIGDKAKIYCSQITQSRIGTNSIVINSQIENSEIGRNCEIGPFAHIRPESTVKDSCRIGNFVEIKKSEIGANCKISHLSYVGDATLGENVNVGCGVIFANYDGANKHHTYVGKNVFIGSNCNLIAPIKIGDGAFIAAGSTVTKNIKDGQFCIARERETIRDSFKNMYAQKFEPQPKRYFGTDGIRLEGSKEEYFDVGRKFGEAISSKNIQKIVLGRDTRKSGKIIREGILSGIKNVQVFDLGVASTPCVAYMTKELKADYGVVITASHNPEKFNGIKVFDGLGQKLSQKDENALEEKLQNIDKLSKNKQKNTKKAANNVKIEKISAQKYISHVTASVQKMPGFEVAIDVSGGSSEKLARAVFEKLGVRAHIIGRSKDHRINDECGCLHIEHLKNYMKDYGVPIGFAYDGDADRVLAIDEKLNLVDGDKFLFVLAKELKKQNKLKNDCIVATVMSNLALIQQLKDEGISTSVTPVGDKYVIDEMNHTGASLGGEQSGHIITKDVCGSGDGLLISVLISYLVFKSQKSLSDLTKLRLYPQFQESFTTTRAQIILDSQEVKTKVDECENFLGEEGRILLRKSGTEPKIRLLVESKNKRKAKKVFDMLKNLIESLC